MNQNRVPAVLQLNLIVIKFGTEEARRLNWDLFKYNFGSLFHSFGCFFVGPGLAIRIICGDEPYQGMDFAETNIILGQIVDFVTAVKKVRHMVVAI